MNARHAWLTLTALSGVLALVGCKDESSDPNIDGGSGCVGGKCDDPGTGTDTDFVGDTDSDTDDSESTTGDEHDPCTGTEGPDFDEFDEGEAAVACEDRRVEAFNDNRESFNNDFLRWSCADTDGRPANERGQEYCEYFGIVRLPDDNGVLSEPFILGMNLGDEHSAGQTPFGLNLTYLDVRSLENDPDAVVGACVFSSWNGDVDMEVPEREVVGVPLEADTFRMKYFPNTNDAAQCLIQECGTFLPPETKESLDDDFTRGCMLNSFLNTTHDRKSDTIICAATNRLAECGCTLEGGAELTEGLAPSDVFGFRLGTWEDIDGLPGGCRYEDLGDGSHNLVTCDLTAAEVLNHSSEIKAHCQEKYADDIVVHVDVAASAVNCNPPADEPYAANCGDTPWVVAR